MTDRPTQTVAERIADAVHDGQGSGSTGYRMTAWKSAQATALDVCEALGIAPSTPVAGVARALTTQAALDAEVERSERDGLEDNIWFAHLAHNNLLRRLRRAACVGEGPEQ